jgi:hypothetical protein
MGGGEMNPKLIPLPNGRTYTVPEVEGLEDSVYWREVFAKRPAKSWLNRTESFQRFLEVFKTLEIKELWETCGGLGVFTRMSYEVRSIKHRLAIDIDPVSARIQVVMNPSTECATGDAAEFLELCATFPPSPWAIFLDYPTFTLKYVEKERWETTVFEQVFFRLKPDYVLVTDSAASKFHLNRLRYGIDKPEPTLEDYYEQYTVVTGYEVLLTDRYYTNGGGATHILLGRRP